jgi:hypothetical protein
MLSTKKYAAMAVVGAGLAFAATPASACGAYGYAPVYSYGGCGAYGYATYHRPYYGYGYGYAAYRPRYYRPYAYASYYPMHRYYRPVYAYAGYSPRFYRPVYAAYRPFYRPMAYGCAC